MWPSLVIWTENRTALYALMKLHSCADFRKRMGGAGALLQKQQLLRRRVCLRGGATKAPRRSHDVLLPYCHIHFYTFLPFFWLLFTKIVPRITPPANLFINAWNFVLLSTLAFGITLMFFHFIYKWIKDVETAQLF